MAGRHHSRATAQQGDGVAGYGRATQNEDGAVEIGGATQDAVEIGGDGTAGRRRRRIRQSDAERGRRRKGDA